MKIQNDKVNEWKGLCSSWLQANTNAPHLTCDDITTGRDAWAIAHRSGVTNDAYKDRTVTDGHIQTALERIFPHAVFKDAKVY